MTMLELSISIEGKTWGDLTQALSEIQRKVEQQYQSGYDSNDTGTFTFSVSGEEEEPKRRGKKA